MRIKRKVLIVEDDEKWTEVARKSLEDAGYYTKTARDGKSAEEFLNTELFHIALVDLELAGGPLGNYYGLDVLEYIKRNYPDCYCLIYTVHFQEKPEKIIKCLSVPNIVANGCFIKQEELVSKLGSFVNTIWKDFVKINDSIEIIPEGFVLEDLLKERFLNNVESVRDSTYLVDIFLSTIGKNFNGDNEIDTVKISPLKKGYSKTLLFKTATRSKLLKDRAGKQVVIKFGNKDVVLQESKNFNKYVQWYLTLNQTTQKIACESINDHAALLFTFAGDSPQNIDTFGDYIRLRDKDLILRECILDMFNPDISRRDWYHPDVIERNKFIKDYYIGSVLSHSPHELNKEFFEKQILRSTKANMKLEKNGEYIVFIDANNLTVYNPYHFCQNSVFSDEYSSCICHGDFNVENIIIDQMGNWYLIDFAHTGRGHVFIDFITLELSIRHSIFWNNKISFNILDIAQFENAIINIFDEDKQEDKLIEDKDYWILKADSLIRLIRNNAIRNFPDESIKLYLLGLFYLALDWTTYHIKIEEKRHFILLAGLLVDAINKLDTN